MITFHKFRIRNYKSIIDSQDCYLSSYITVLAGKNESGKSSALEALEDFHEEKEIRIDATPINEEVKPTIEATFSTNHDSLNKIFSEIGIENKLKSKTLITIIKKYPKNYYLSDETIQSLGLNTTSSEERDTYSASILTAHTQLQEIISQNNESLLTLPTLNLDNKATTETFQKEITQFKQELPSHLDKFQEETQRAAINENVDQLIESLKKLTAIKDPVQDFLDIFIKKYLPYFILYSSFEDIFPSSIKKDQLAESAWAQDLEQISNFKISEITSDNAQQRRNHAESTNIEFSDIFKEYWTQDDICLEIHPDGENIYFWIKDNKSGKSYTPAQRSKGQQWYLGFYTKIVARIREDKPNVILIDEPGLYLHAKAQRDLLKALNKNAKDNNATIIFSTHSPYLIDDKELERIRLIERRIKTGTIITGKLHTHPSASKETLTPILTAIGLGLNDGIDHFNKKSVIVEGPSDAFYLQAFSIIINEDKLSFVNGGGAGNMPFVGTIAQGWGSRVLYLFDNDQGKSDGEKNLEDNWHITKSEIQAVIDTSGSIEDIFSKDDFKKHVLEDDSVEIKTMNSAYVKASKKDKVLLSRLFLQRANRVRLDETTNKNIRSLFNNLNKYFDDLKTAEKS